MTEKEKIKNLQQSFDRFDYETKMSLAASFLDFSIVNTSELIIPLESDPRKADFIFREQVYQITMVSQPPNATTPPGTEPVGESRKLIADLIKHPTPPPHKMIALWGDLVGDFVYSIEKKYSQYKKIGIDTRDMILIVEVPDFYKEVFRDGFEDHALEIKKRIDNKNIVFKEIWLAERNIQNDKPVYTRKKLVTNILLNHSL